MKPIRLAIIGATGLVGRATLHMLAEWQVPLQKLRLFASDDSIGRELAFEGTQYPLEPLSEPPSDIDFAIFATSRTISRRWVPEFRKAGIIVIDHSSEFRMNPDVPLVIPEVNGHALKKHNKLVANPNCSASIIIIPLCAIHQIAGLKTVIADTYQSVSGSGQEAVVELESQLETPTLAPRVYPRTIAHNVFPQVGAFDAHGKCDEEQKVIQELQKMLEKPDLRVFTTTVRVPVRIGHSAAVTVECEQAVTQRAIEDAFRFMPGMIYDEGSYRTPVEIAGLQEVFVGRLRIDIDNPQWLQFWVVGDNLRKGAASNAVQILMELNKN